MFCGAAALLVMTIGAGAAGAKKADFRPVDKVVLFSSDGMRPDLKSSCLRRLKRIEGQVRDLARMVEDDRYCIDILTQISAIQAALDKVSLGLLDDHAHHCVIGAKQSEQHERTEELMGAVGRLMHRG